MNYTSAAATDRPRRKSLVVKRSVKVGNKTTSLALEDAFWNALQDIAASQGTSVSRLLEAIDSERRERLHANLSSAVRLFVLDYYRSRCSPDTAQHKPAAAIGNPPPELLKERARRPSVDRKGSRMTRELYVDGVGQITVGGGVVRVDFVACRANNKPIATFRQRLIFSVEGFANAVEAMQKALKGQMPV